MVQLRGLFRIIGASTKSIGIFFKKRLMMMEGESVVAKKESVVSPKKRPSKTYPTEVTSKVLKLDENISEDASIKIEKKIKKKNFAILMCYSGKGYYGMQINKGVQTIESELLKALANSKLITEDDAADPGKCNYFQRCARTDKGVSAAGQIVNLFMSPPLEDTIDLINSHLPEQIKLLDIIRTTKGFNCKKFCSYRSYLYTLPSFAFCPIDTKVTEDYRITSEIIEKINEVLVMFKGTHNFYNYTSGRKPDDKSAVRYIVDFECSAPMLKDGMELLEIRIKGQSFMLHQIRKMIGVTIAIVKGYTDLTAIEKSWQPKRIDVPRAPALGLMLDKTHMDWYNGRFCQDNLHQPLLWEPYVEAINNFKTKYIYSDIVKTEKEEKSMLMWLQTIHLHTFEYRSDNEGSPDEENLSLKAHFHVIDDRKNLKKECISSKDECTSSKDECTSSKDECTSSKDECTSSKDECTSSKDECTSSKDEGTSTENV